MFDLNRDFKYKSVRKVDLKRNGFIIQIFFGDSP